MLLDFPPEIREQILGFALTSTKPLVTFHIDEYQREAYEEALQPPLLFVSRQIRQEALPLFYSSNDFIFFTEGKKAEEAQTWLQRFQQYLAYLEGASFWVRHINRARSHIGPNGAFSITMRLSLRTRHWMVGPHQWISPVRRPTDYDDDGSYLTKELQHLMDTRQLDVDLLASLMTALRKSYVHHKQLTF